MSLARVRGAWRSSAVLGDEAEPNRRASGNVLAGGRAGRAESNEEESMFPFARVASDCIDSRQPWVNRLNIKAFKGNTIDNMCVFNKIGHFEAIEIFSVEPFVMLGIDSGWPEKLVRFLSPNQDWRIRTKHDPDGHFNHWWCAERMSSIRKLGHRRT